MMYVSENVYSHGYDREHERGSRGVRDGGGGDGRGGRGGHCERGKVNVNVNDRGSVHANGYENGRENGGREDPS